MFAIRKRRKTFAVEMVALARSSDIQRSFLSGAGGGGRTRTVVMPRDFKSLVSAIPPHRRVGIFEHRMGGASRRNPVGGRRWEIAEN